MPPRMYPIRIPMTLTGFGSRAALLFWLGGTGTDDAVSIASPRMENDYVVRRFGALYTGKSIDGGPAGAGGGCTSACWSSRRATTPPARSGRLRAYRADAMCVSSMTG